MHHRNIQIRRAFFARRININGYFDKYDGCSKNE